jgi:hypothetical protein
LLLLVSVEFSQNLREIPHSPIQENPGKGGLFRADIPKKSLSGDPTTSQESPQGWDWGSGDNPLPRYLSSILGVNHSGTLISGPGALPENAGMNFFAEGRREK